MTMMMMYGLQRRRLVAALHQSITASSSSSSSSSRSSRSRDIDRRRDKQAVPPATQLGTHEH